MSLSQFRMDILGIIAGYAHAPKKGRAKNWDKVPSEIGGKVEWTIRAGERGRTELTPHKKKGKPAEGRHQR